MKCFNYLCDINIPYFQLKTKFIHMRKTLLAMTTALLAGAATLFAAPGKLVESRPELPLKACISIPGGPTLRIQPDAADEAAASVPGITRLSEPAASAAPVRRTDEAEPQWSEWRHYLSGEISLDKNIYEQLFGEGSLPTHIDVERRDDLNNPMRAQLKFVRLLGDLDLIMDYDIEAGLVDWEPVDLGRRFPGNDYGYDVIFKHGALGAYFHPKRTMTTSVWFLVEPNLGYNRPFMFTPDTKPAVTFDVRFEQENVNSDRATVTIPTLGGASDKIKYTINDNPLGYSFDKDGEIIMFMNILDSDYPGFNIRSVTPAQAPTWTEEVNLTDSGPYYLHFGVYDADGDRIEYRVLKLFPALPEPDKWHSIGTGTFTDYTVRDFLQLAADYGHTLPDWWDTTSWNVEIEESNTTPGLYRVVNPFGAGSPFSDFSYSVSDESTFTQSNEIKFDREHNYYMVIHAENPAFVWTEETLMGFTTHTTTVDDGQTYDEGIINHTYTWRHGYEAVHYLDSPPQTSSVLSFKDLRIMSTYYNNGNNFTLTLPGFINYDFNITTDKNAINFDFTGEGTSRVDYVVADFGTVDEAAILEALRNGTLENAHSISASGQVSAEELGAEYGRAYTILAVSFDSNGQAHEERTVIFSFQERTYNFYGQAIFNEPLWSNRYYVDLYQSPDTPGNIFYVHNPYGVFIEFDKTHDRYMAVDCTDPERVRIEPFNIGIDLGNGPVIIATPEYAYRDLGYSEDEIVKAAPFGRFAYGEIDFGPGTAAKIPFIYDNPSEVTWSIYGKGSIEGIPGYRDPRFSLRQTEDGGIELYDFHKDTGTIAYTIVDASEISENDFYDSLGDTESLNGYEIIYATEEGPLDLSKWNIEPLHDYIVGAVSLWPGDISPEYRTTLKFTSLPETEYLTQAEVTETILAVAFDGMGVVTLEVPVYTSAQYPGCLLLKDLYKAHPVIGEHITAKAPIYTVIDCTDPQKVYIRDCDTGCPYTSSSNLFIMSRPALSSFDPAANPEFYGTFDGRTVSIPAGAAVLRFDDYFVPVANEEFVVRLHNDISGVTNITTEAPADAPAEYFDILGRRVLRPSPGSLYIVRRGNAVTKEIR